MVPTIKKINLGCGFKKIPGWINVDAYDICVPDVVLDLNSTPWKQWDDNSIDVIRATHVFEHLENWWNVFVECGRILKSGGSLEISVPHISSDTAIGYRDHVSIVSVLSFHGCIGSRHATNAWAATISESVPLRLITRQVVPYKKYYWMMKWPFKYLLSFCANHLRNFIHEDMYVFKKI